MGNQTPAIAGLRTPARTPVAQDKVLLEAQNLIALTKAQTVSDFSLCSALQIVKFVFVLFVFVDIHFVATARWLQHGPQPLRLLFRYTSCYPHRHSQRARRMFCPYTYPSRLVD